MPIYEYECQACGHVLDALQKISDEPLKHCPTCGEGALKKLLSAPRFRLKGSGWYETDFKDKNRRNIASEDSGEGKKAAAGKADAGDKGKTTDKPAAKNTASASTPAKTAPSKTGDGGS
ncbi:MAG: zinc ribbon domain-containing protein [Gammaproteobacteria bacterium]|jgi:putative FmdB family regulatory protein